MATLRDIIEEYDIEKKDLAKQLFPNAKYPDLALIRILDYSDELSLRQLVIIADLAGCQTLDLVETLLQLN